MLYDRRSLGLKIEVTPGTAETITAAEILPAENIVFDEEVESLVRASQVGTLSKLAPMAGRSQAGVSFDIPMYGSSAAGTAPCWGPAVRSCAFGETIVGATSVQYLPVSTGMKTCTIKVFVDGISYQLKYCMGSVSAKRDAGKVPMLSFKFKGLWAVGTDASAVKDEAVLLGNALPAFNPKAFRAALLVADTYRGVTEGWSWDVANDLAVVPDANVTDFKRVEVTGRAVSGEIDMEAIVKATYDFHAKLAAKTQIQIRGFIGADDAAHTTAGGTGAASSLTDAAKNWITNQWAGYKLLDSALVVFPIASNTATVLTVTGTPASGAYIIYQAGKLIRETVPKAAIRKINDKNSGGIYHFGMPFDAGMNAGDDELEIFCI